MYIYFRLVLDIGCGIHACGNVNLDIKPIYPIPENFIIADMHKTPFVKEVFNCVKMRHVLEHTDYNKARIVLSEAKRVLIKSGILELWLPNFSGLSVLKTWILERNLQNKRFLCGIINCIPENEYDIHKSIWNFHLIEHYLNNAGFKIINKQGYRLIGFKRNIVITFIGKMLVRLFPSRWDNIYISSRVNADTI